MVFSLMSPFISTSAPQTTSCSSFLAMRGLSSPLALKGQMKLTAAVLLVLLSVALLASSCEARGLRVHGKGSSSNKHSHLPAGKDVARTMDGTAIDDHLTRPDSKMEGVAMSSPAAAVPATPIVQVSQRLFQREDIEFHLDYAGPGTHPPSHN